MLEQKRVCIKYTDLKTQHNKRDACKLKLYSVVPGWKGSFIETTAFSMWCGINIDESYCVENNIFYYNNVDDALKVYRENNDLICIECAAKISKQLFKRLF
jgi:hypothetical protein